jgi:hypothetical protein
MCTEHLSWWLWTLWYVNVVQSKPLTTLKSTASASDGKASLRLVEFTAKIKNHQFQVPVQPDNTPMDHFRSDIVPKGMPNDEHDHLHLSPALLVMFRLRHSFWSCLFNIQVKVPSPILFNNLVQAFPSDGNAWVKKTVVHLLKSLAHLPVAWTPWLTSTRLLIEINRLKSEWRGMLQSVAEKGHLGGPVVQF